MPPSPIPLRPAPLPSRPPPFVPGYDSADIGNDDYCVPLYLATTSLRKLNACTPPPAPPRLTLARVAVVAAEPGPLAGSCCVDDYIRAVEPTYDYLTRWSGICPGDLDPQVSRHYTTTLKHTYLKLKWVRGPGGGAELKWVRGPGAGRLAAVGVQGRRQGDEGG